MLSYDYPLSLSVPSLFACPRYLSCSSYVSRWGLELLFPTPGVFSRDRLPLTDVQEPADCSQSDVLPSYVIEGLPLYLAEVSLHNLELFFEVGSQVQPLLLRGRLK